MNEFDWNVVWYAVPYLAAGAVVTLELSALGMLFGTTIGGLSTALQNFYSAFSDVANNPTSTASRQALLGQAQSVASSFQTASGELNSLNTDVNSRVTADVTQINSITQAISALNKQIVTGTAQDGGQQPNELLDQRDQLVSNLSQLVNISTTTDSNGSFKITTPFTCPANSQAYIIASGGNPGLATGTDNSAMMMATAIGRISRSIPRLSIE